jgi:ABC-type methionine transport system ATPase subunit
MIELKGITKDYMHEDILITRALAGVDLTINDGDFFAIM